MKVKKVRLIGFRNFKDASVSLNDRTLMIGSNDIGKTNLLEAISFLSPGKGFKNCRLDEVINTNTNLNQCSIFFVIENGNEKNEIGISFANESTGNRTQGRKIIYLNGKKLKKKSDLPTLVSLIWLIPEMDIFFRTNSLFRRKFVDRCIFNLKPEYLDYLRIYEKNLKERSKILKDSCKENIFYIEGKNIEKDLWLKKIEEILVNEGLKIFQERIKFSNDFNALSNNSLNFPKIQIFLIGKIEKFLVSQDIDSVKKIYLQKLHKSRKIDSIKGSISYGPNKSDLKVIFLKKRLLAEKCSTGEQKIILISLIIQFCKLMNNKGNFPILLLDEIVAHLDNKIKISLFEELKTLKNQVWMSGSDKSLFSDIIKEKEVVNLEIEDLLKQ